MAEFERLQGHLNQHFEDSNVQYEVLDQSVDLTDDMGDAAEEGVYKVKAYFPNGKVAIVTMNFEWE